MGFEMALELLADLHFEEWLLITLEWSLKMASEHLKDLHFGTP